MRLFITFLTVLILSSCADNSMSQRDMNLKVVNTFWDNILTENYQVALDLLHEDLEFEFMGICTCLSYTSPSPRDLYRSRMPSSA